MLLSFVRDALSCHYYSAVSQHVCVPAAAGLFFGGAACSLADKAAKAAPGAGQKLGGDSSAAAAGSADDMRARLAAAAEARFKAQGA